MNNQNKLRDVLDKLYQKGYDAGSNREGYMVGLEGQYKSAYDKILALIEEETIKMAEISAKFYGGYYGGRVAWKKELLQKLPKKIEIELRAPRGKG